MDDYERKAVHERVRTALAALIGSRVSAPTFANSVAVWSEWRDTNAKTHFTRRVKRYVRGILHSLAEAGLECNPAGDSGLGNDRTLSTPRHGTVQQWAGW